jgi:hypothetical protein
MPTTTCADLTTEDMTQPFFKRYRLPLVGGSLAVLAVGLVSYFTSVADIRPPLVQRGITAESSASGRALLEKMDKAHGGAAAWKDLGTARYTLDDNWPGPASVASPWPKNPGRMTLTFKTAADTGRLEIEGGETWGVQQWATYSVDAAGTVKFDAERNFDRWFWVPTVAYFLEAPYRLGEASVVADAGKAEYNGIVCDRVFLTWGDGKPNRDIDQYLAWIDQKSGRLVRLEYTVRDFAGFMQSGMDYSDYRDVGGLPIPHEIGGDHTMKVQKVELGVQVPDSFLLPDPTRREAK